MILLTAKNQEKLKEYLLYHEKDIAIGIDDFSDLKDIFKAVFNREPEKDSNNV